MLVCGTDQSLPSVPRSKGCLNCVARKTRCDGRRPACRACENRKQACGGYRRDEVIFLSEGWRALGVASVNRNKITKPDSADRSTFLSSESPTVQGSEINGADSDLVLYPSPTIDRSHLHIAFFLGSFGTRPFQALGALGHLFRHYFPLVSSNESGSQTWSMSPSTPVVFAVDALAYSHFGTANADPVAVRQGFRSYGMALQSMSVRLAEMKRADSDFHDISEEDWQHFAFFCLVMAFWEMKMSPVSRNWENHIRCLAAAIILRGTDHAYSKINFQLLASSRLLLMLQTLSARKPNESQKSPPIRSAWMVEIKSALGVAKDPRLGADFELYHSIDSMMIDVTAIVSTMARFDQLLTRRSNSTELDDEDSNQILLNLYDTAESILSQNEARLARWNTNICEISLSSWLSLYQNMATDPLSGRYWPGMNEQDVRSHFDTVLTFRTMMEYHSISLYWTIIMSLRLLLSDMLALMVRTNAGGLPANSRQKIEDHRIQLMKYALNVLRTICYATHTESRAVAPFALTTAFQLTVVVLERECKSLQAEGGKKEEKIRRCDGLKSLAVRYLDWALQYKIPVTIDLESPRKWSLATIAEVEKGGNTP